MKKCVKCNKDLNKRNTTSAQRKHGRNVCKFCYNARIRELYNGAERIIKKPIVAGTKFSKLTVEKFSHKYKDGSAVYQCKCECGNTAFINVNFLKNGQTKSCGCLRKEGMLGPLNPAWNPDRVLIKAKEKIKTFTKNTLKALLKNKNGKTSNGLFGYDRYSLINYLENLFNSKMSWKNYGTYWNIDHIVPVAWFVEHNIIDPKIINAKKNLRPLPIYQNCQKRDTIIKEAEVLIKELLSATNDK